MMNNDTLNNKEQKSILIFEDDFDLVWQWKRFLKRKGYIVDVSWDIEEVIKLCEIKQYDIIVCDIFIKDLDGKIKMQGGVSLLTYLRSKSLGKFPKWTQNVPVLLISGAQKVNGFDALYSTKTLGANEVIRKPFRKEELLEKIIKILETKVE